LHAQYLDFGREFAQLFSAYRFEARRTQLYDKKKWAH
jgi:hypothetical protein